MNNNANVGLGGGGAAGGAGGGGGGGAGGVGGLLQALLNTQQPQVNQNLATGFLLGSAFSGGLQSPYPFGFYGAYPYYSYPYYYYYYPYYYRG